MTEALRAIHRFAEIFAELAKRLVLTGPHPRLF